VAVDQMRMTSQLNHNGVNYIILEGDGWGMLHIYQLHTRILDLVDEKRLKSLIGSSTRII